MKTIKLLTPIAIALAVLTASPDAEQQVAKELEPSLTSFKAVSTSMPDFRGVTFYQAFPDSRGSLVQGIGHSNAVRGWFYQMNQMVSEFAKIDNKLELDVAVYADTVREEGEKVLGATGDLNKALNSLNRATSGKVMDLLALYNGEVRATWLARKDFDAATKRAEEAGYLIESTDAGATECNLLLERTKLEAEKSALLERIARDTAFLNTVEKVIDTLAGGPTGIASYVAGEALDAAKVIVIEAFHASTRETLYEIGTKIEAIEKSMQDVKCKQQTSALKAAKANLEARMVQMLVAFGKILEHRAAAWSAVDRLGTLQDPGTGRTLAFFVNLQAYNSQVNTMGRQVFDSVAEYLAFLGEDPLARGGIVLSLVKEDIDVVDREKEKRDPSGTWSRAALGTKDYLDAYAAWYTGEISRGQAALINLREGRHLDFVDRMLARATKELGGTVSYENIIR